MLSEVQTIYIMVELMPLSLSRLLLYCKSRMIYLSGAGLPRMSKTIISV